jgi:4-hydroxybenzoate polyprenyltransferase
MTVPAGRARLETAARVAQAVTVTSAVLYAFAFLLPGHGGDVVSDVLLVCLIVGGIAMGLLYAARRTGRS